MPRQESGSCGLCFVRPAFGQLRMRNPNDKLEHYVALARTARGAAAADVCSKATSDPHLHVFGELLDVPAIVELAEGSHAAHYRLLRLFAEGSYSEWVASKDDYPPLNEAQQSKLRTLSLVSCAAGRSVVPYATLLGELGMSSTRELEQFLLNASYSGLISLRLDQRAQRVLVSAVAGRDIVSQEQAAAMRTCLVDWKAASERLLSVIDERIAFVTAEAARASKVQAEKEIEQRRTRESVRAAEAQELISSGAMHAGPDSLFELIDTNDLSGMQPGFARRDRRMQASRPSKSRFES